MQVAPVGAMGSMLPEMLGYAPVLPSSTRELARFVDLERWAELTGIQPPTDGDREQLEAWQRSLEGSGVNYAFFRSGLDANWSELAGFDVADVSQILQVGDPPEDVRILRGDFELRRLQAAWDEHGYTPVELEGVQAAASLFEDFELDISTELGLASIGKMNNAALLDDGTLVYAVTLTGLREVVAVSRGDAPSLLRRVDVAALLTGQTEPLASAAIYHGVNFFDREPHGSGEETIGPAILGILGVNPNPISAASPEAASSPGTVSISTLFLTAPIAEAAVPVIEKRLETEISTVTKRPFRDYYSDWDVVLADNEQIVKLRLAIRPGKPIDTWLQQTLKRDFSFMSWTTA
jgi:hypothetical protein